MANPIETLQETFSDNTTVLRKDAQNRIIFVEPNDINGHLNGVPVTPDYTDFCISFDLIVDVVSRMRANSVTISCDPPKNPDDDKSQLQAMKTYVISWSSKYDPDGTQKNNNPNQVSFMGGVRYGDRDYLTTFYTDTHYNDFKNKTIVEGLGVESVNVSFESYYAPTVKIRFIDVRGASIFGREEVLHTDEVLKEDTIWGCFFTFPYPKYRLQIKGFYGQAVTYQLCCTDFRANFNSQTGNYEIDMTFLGYDFGLLADIPIQYLIAAPYCHYGNTMAHWEKESSSNDAWKMSDGRPPKTFYEIKQKIKAAMEKYRSNDEQNVTTEEYEVAIVNEERKAVMDKMKPLIDSLDKYYNPQNYTDAQQLANSVESTFGTVPSAVRRYTENRYTQVQGSSVLTAEKANNKLTELNKLYTEYKEKWPDNVLGKSNIILTQQFTSQTNDRTIVSFASDLDEINSEVYLQGTDGKTNFNNFKSKFNEEYNTLSQVITYNTQITSSQVTEKEKIQELVGFLPNIGNVFRTLYCHLETFVHMIYTCADNIYSQIRNNERGYAKLGVPGIEFTDINIDSTTNDQMDPFPAIYTYQKPNSEDNNTGQDDVTDEVQVDSWMGELPKGNRMIWEEEVLIEELFNAILHTKMDSDDTPANFNSTQFPVLPSDLNHTTIAGIGLNTTPDDLAGYLAIRAASLFGISGYADSEAEEVGKTEAFNYFESIASKTAIKNKILDTLGNGNKADALYNIMLCEGEYANANKPLKFEKAENLIRLKNTNKSKRQPFFVINSNKNLQYCYAEDDESNAFVPSRLANWGELNSDILTYHGSANGSYYAFKTLSGPSSNILYKIHSDKLTDVLDEGDKRFYVNNEIFTVYYGGSYGDGSVIADKVEEIYDNMQDGSVSLNGYTKESDPNRFKTIIKNHWKNIKLDQYQSAYYSKLHSLYAPLDEYGIDKSTTGIQSDGTIKIESGTAYSLIINKNVSFSNGSFKNGDKEISEEQCKPLIPELRLYYNNTNTTMNVFTTSVYYLQNDINSIYNGKNFTWSSKDTTREAMKALLFLSSLDYMADTKPNYLNNKNSGKIENVPLSIILFHGGLLWRKRFYERNGFDSMLYTASDGSKVIKTMAKDEIPIVTVTETTHARGFIKPNDGYQYKKYSFLTGEEELDPAIENKLIEKFIYFLNNEWKTIADNCELKKTGGELLKYSDFKELCIKSGEITNDELNTLEKTSYVGKYFYINRFNTVKDNGLESILSEDNPALDTIKEIYLSRIVVQRTVSSFTNKNGSVAIEPNTLKKYLNGFVKQIEEICSSETINTLSKNPEIEDNEQDRDIKRLIYMYIKNMWDRWFSGNSEKTFSVKNYMANTIFIDSMYRNVYEHIHINCEILESLLDETDGKAMAFKFLSDLTTKHHCMYFAMPDYINLGDTNRDKAEEALLTLFNPIPYSKINKIQTFNRYIVMFTHKPSEINENANSYKYDSFDIYSHDENKTNILPTFAKPCITGENLSEHDLQCTRYGYNVPAFGVEFGRQNNAIFKKINVGMQNPIQTEQAINALSLIANRGRGAGERTIFYGQDLYSVYSGYSYTATIEMMGNAQIMPLMYFQLFNVPMFRGAYMIYSVTHTMRPGDMTTTVKAMKMSKRTLPWCQEWFAHYYFDSEGNIIDKEYDDECGKLSEGMCKGRLASEQKLKPSEITNNFAGTLAKQVGKNRFHSREPEMLREINNNVVAFQVRLRSTEKDDNGQNKTMTKWIVVHRLLESSVKQIFEEIYNNTDYKFNPGQFYGEYGKLGEKNFPEIRKGEKIIGSYEYRETKKGSVSNHAFACAIDINPGYNPMIGCLDQYTDDDLHIRSKKHPVVQIFAKHGWGWGGSYGDFMHFSPFNGS